MGSNGGSSFHETNITGIYPPLGLAYIASVLRNAGYQVTFLDNRISRLHNDFLKKKIAKIAPDVVLFSSMTLFWPELINLGLIIKDISPQIVIGVGGPHLTVYPKESLSSEVIDFGVYGEGENTILEVIEAIRKGEELDEIKGCIFRKNGKIIVNPPREVINDLDSIPFPAIDLLSYKRYFALSVKHPFFVMVTSRGCPYACKFCFQGYLGQYRARSPENVVEEMEILVNRYKVQEIIIFDETFAVEGERAAKICELISKKGMKFKWDVRMRVDLLNKEILKALKSAGCSRIHLGIESGSQETLYKMAKGINIPEIVEKVKLARKFGFELRGYFMLAYPGETHRDILKTVEFAKSLPLDWASFTITIGLPETEIYKEGLRNRTFHVDYWKEYTKGNTLNSKPYFVPDGQDESDLFALKRKAYLEFYFRPKIIWNILKNSKLTGMINNFHLFVKLLPSVYHSIAKI